ncbi:MAG: sugar ABC transporter permease, partial [Lactococcus sp.]|nr:sugar ABC transporter permease [Lactococcus sp.]
MNNLILDDHYSMKDVFIKGDLITKLSFVFSGLNNLRHKQLIKGFSFLIAEVLFLLTFVIQVIPALGGLISLGTQTQGIKTITQDGIKIQVAIKGDNSMLIMIFGVASVIFVCGYCYILWCGLKS